MLLFKLLRFIENVCAYAKGLRHDVNSQNRLLTFHKRYAWT